MMRTLLSWDVATDFELLEAWRAGDRDAGAELFSRHFASVYGFFRSKIEHVADDLTQQTFLSCVEGRDDFRGASSFKTYLLVIARNKLFTFLKRRDRHPEAPNFEEDSLADLEPSPSTLLVARQEHRVLVHALRRLPLVVQVTLELYYVQRMRGDEIAEVLGVPPGTVRSRIRRGIAQLRENIADASASAPGVRTTLTDLYRWAESVRQAAPG